MPDATNALPHEPVLNDYTRLITGLSVGEGYFDGWVGGSLGWEVDVWCHVKTENRTIHYFSSMTTSPSVFQLLTILCVLASVNANSQNLVPNHSFEETACTGFVNHEWGAAGWYNPNLGSPDLYGTYTEPGCIVEYNNPAMTSAGEYQTPQDGDQMGSIVFYIQGTCIREYVGCKLIEPLEAGETYTASMQVVLTNHSTACTDCFGFHLSTDSIAYEDVCDLGALPTAEPTTSTCVSDTLNWTEITAEFTAAGGEAYLIIGNIHANEQCEYHTLYDAEDPFLNVKYYFDNVVIQKKDDSTTQVDSTRPPSPLSVYPNPTHGDLNINTKSVGSGYAILDHLGRTIQAGSLLSKSISTECLAVGSYLLVVDTVDGTRTVVRFEKQ